jgi:hypothetical protein
MRRHVFAGRHHWEALAMRPGSRGATAAAAALLLSAALTATATATAGGISGGTEAMHVTRTRGATGSIQASAVNNLQYQGGAVQTGSPKVYISWWGTQWSTGFTTGGYTSGKAQTYVTDFFGNVGGSSWNNIDTQYCQGVATGTEQCGSAGTHIPNPTAQLKGTWNDTTALPRSIKQSDIASAAVRLMSHFGGYDANATYMVFTPSGRSMAGFRTSWCAWHSMTTNNGNKVAYAYIPYMPDAAGSCGMNFVNGTNNTYGNGYFDGFSIVAGHEYAEAQTDPFPSSGNYGWIDAGGAENADKCAWSGSSANISLGGQSFAVQPIWSNASNGCAMSY